MSYFGQIRRGIKTSIKGLSLTWRHLWAARRGLGPRNVQDPGYFEFSGGHVTLQYPHEMISIPDHGRNQLDCEIDDCIVCDKCAKICPVNCIEIEAIKSPEIIRHTSDGSPVRLHAAKFDIDLAKCCFCGLCTTVCPTECLTMNNEFDYSVVDIRDLNFAFSNLSEAEVQEKQALYAQYMAEKEEAKAKASGSGVVEKEEVSLRPRPAFKPKAKPEISIEESQSKGVEESSPKLEEPEAAPSRPRPVFVPKAKPVEPLAGEEDTPTVESETEKVTPSPRPKPLFRPKAKPTLEVTDGSQTSQIQESTTEELPQEKPSLEAPKVAFKPKMKPQNEEGSVEKKPFVLKMKPKSE